MFRQMAKQGVTFLIILEVQALYLGRETATQQLFFCEKDQGKHFFQ